MSEVVSDSASMEGAKSQPFVEGNSGAGLEFRGKRERFKEVYQNGEANHVQAGQAAFGGAADFDSMDREQIWLLVYDELRRLAQAKMSCLPDGHTLQPTALVHEAYLRLSNSEDVMTKGRAYFFAAASEAMRRILVDDFRRKSRKKRGGGWERIDINDLTIAQESEPNEVLFVNDVLGGLAEQDPLCAELVKLRFFAGMSNQEAALVLNISPRSASRNWTYARAWLSAEFDGMRNNQKD